MVSSLTESTTTDECIAKLGLKSPHHVSAQQQATQTLYTHASSLVFSINGATVGWVIRPVKTVGRITYIVLVQTLNYAQSINQQRPTFL